MPQSVRRVGIVVKPGLAEAGGVLRDIASWLQQRGVTPMFDTESGVLGGSAGHEVLEQDALPAAVDLMVVLGGDGTLLATARRIARARADTPVLAVNFGSLGFLTEITLPELHAALESAVAGTAVVEERMMLRATIVRAGAPGEETPVLNDIVVNRGPLSRMTDVSLSVDDLFVARFKADGLIVATATGSTAYSLSAGGPIVHPQVDAILVTPIAPHTLTNRPVVMPASAVLTIQPLVEGSQVMYATADGQAGFELTGQDAVSVRRADRPLRLICSATRSYFGVLRQKLKWAER